MAEKFREYTKDFNLKRNEGNSFEQRWKISRAQVNKLRSSGNSIVDDSSKATRLNPFFWLVYSTHYGTALVLPEAVLDDTRSRWIISFSIVQALHALNNIK